jgi:hypothetical protein
MGTMKWLHLLMGGKANFSNVVLSPAHKLKDKI